MLSSEKILYIARAREMHILSLSTRCCNKFNINLIYPDLQSRLGLSDWKRIKISVQFRRLTHTCTYIYVYMYLCVRVCMCTIDAFCSPFPTPLSVCVCVSKYYFLYLRVQCLSHFRCSLFTFDILTFN